MKTYKIAVLSGDGVGPEVTAEALRVLQAAGEGFGLSLSCLLYTSPSPRDS